MFIHFLTEPRHRVQAGVVYLQSLSRQTRVVCRRFISMVREDPLAPEVSLICQQLVAEALRKVPKGDWQPVYTDARITETVALIQASYPSRRSNRDLARSVGMHTNAFIRLFRSVTGCTPVDFLKNARLEEACVLLHQTDTSIEDIAEKTGFCDRGHFSRVFTQAIGYSPARYRSFVNVCGRVRR
jgi:transcriptional regulator GlxA family with amidase domain